MNAFILRLSKTGDDDAIVDWLSDRDVYFSTFVKGLQSKRRFPNGLERFAVYELELPQSNADRPSLKRAELVQSFVELVEKPLAFAAASASLESLSSLVPLDTPPQGLFKNTLSTWAAMHTAEELSLLTLAWFETQILEAFTLMPNLESCLHCTQVLGNSSFFEQEFGFLCSACAQNKNNTSPLIIPALKKLRSQSLQTTLSNALQNQEASQQRQALLLAILKVDMAILKDNGYYKNLKAHQYLFEYLST